MAGAPLDFTSALYLGLRHASASLRPWARLTTGRPAALAEPPAALEAAARLARLTELEDGVLARSTLHAAWDLVPLAARRRRPAAVLMDAGTYPVARWGVERAVGRGAAVASFGHHDPGDLARHARAAAAAGRRALVVADGLCAGCGEPAPVGPYAEIARRFGGALLLDDTQALGLVGPGGGGSLRRSAGGPDAVAFSSLAKAFGAPLAFVGGPRAEVDALRAAGETRVHCSPPSLADVHACLAALDVNEVAGDRLRARLAELVGRFRCGVERLGLLVIGGRFPVQGVRPPPGLSAEELQRRLRARGVRALLHRPTCASDVRVSFLITAAHSLWQVDRALAAIAAAAGGSRA